MIPIRVSSIEASKDVIEVFPGWIQEYAQPDWHVLDVGAGSGLNQVARPLRSSVARLIGVDPDEAIKQNPYLTAYRQTTLETFAQTSKQSFDCLYSAFVLEHVMQPAAFLQASLRLLKPGGMLFVLTPNLWHYFGLTTKLCTMLGIDDWLLERLLGKQVKESYHFPTAYRLNSLGSLRKALTQAGFVKAEFRYIDQTNRFVSYFPSILRWFPPLYSHLVYRCSVPPLMGLILLRAVAPT